MGNTDFDAVCDGPLAEVLSGLEQGRRTAVRNFWIGMAITGVVVALCLAFVPGGLAPKLVVAVLVGVVGWVVASLPLSKAGRSLKEPALAAICAARGYSFTGEKFAPDGYDVLQRAFGNPTGRVFSDRFSGEDEGRPFAFYEASLVKGSGKSRQTVFQGLIINGRRASALQGDTVIVPDRGLFNFFGAGGGLERVKFDDDPEFERKYEVYGSRPEETRALLNPVVRQKFKDWRNSHPQVTAHIGGEAFSVAFHTPNSNRFEAGSMMKATPGRDRVRAMWNDLESALAQMRDARSALS